MTSFEARQRAQGEAASARASSSAVTSEGGASKPLRGLANVESAERIARRLDRLSRYDAGEDLPATPGETPAAVPEEVLVAAVERGGLGLSLGSLRDFDPLVAREAISTAREVRSEADLVL